jgi:hypothetical protein
MKVQAVTRRRLAVRFSLPSYSMLRFWQVDLPRFWGVQFAACFCLHPWRPRLPSTTVCVTHAAGTNPRPKIEFHEEVFWKRVLFLLFGPQVGDSANSALPRIRHSAVFHRLSSCSKHTREYEMSSLGMDHDFLKCANAAIACSLLAARYQASSMWWTELITESGCSLRPSSVMSFETERMTALCHGPYFPFVACFWRLPLSRKEPLRS